jgi:heptosyltransferase-2
VRENTNTDIFRFIPAVNRVIKSKNDRSSLIRTTLREIRKLKIDIALHCHAERWFTSSVISFLSGARIRIGYNKKHQGFLNTNTIEFNYDVSIHRQNIPIVEYYYKLLEPLNLSRISGEKKLIIPPMIHEWLNTYLISNQLKNKLTIGIHPGCDSKGKGKRWSIENFIELINYILLKYSDAVVLIFIGPDELDLEIQFSERLKSPKYIIIKNSLEKIIALVSVCSIIVCNDSFLLHVSQALGSRTIAIFGPTNHILQKSNTKNDKIFNVFKDLECRPCWVSNPVICKYNDFRCLGKITVEEVIKVFEKVYNMELNNYFKKVNLS